jgi:hypothetical protein
VRISDGENAVKSAWQDARRAPRAQRASIDRGGVEDMQLGGLLAQIGGRSDDPAAELARVFVPRHEQHFLDQVIRTEVEALRPPDPRGRRNRPGPLRYKVPRKACGAVPWTRRMGTLARSASRSSNAALHGAAACRAASAWTSRGGAGGALDSLSSGALVHGLATLINEGGVDPTQYGCSNVLQLTKSILERGSDGRAP